MNKTLMAGLLALYGVAGQAACPSWPTADRFTLNGAEVTDKRTGLVWARCSVGQSWSGNACTGTASTFTHQQALQHAAGQSGWRLPDKRELFSLADKGCSSPAIDSTAFPKTHNSWYWTSSPVVGNSNGAWGVNFDVGYVYSNPRDGNGRVRLVRAGQ